MKIVVYKIVEHLTEDNPYRHFIYIGLSDDSLYLMTKEVHSQLCYPIMPIHVVENGFDPNMNYHVFVRHTEADLIVPPLQPYDKVDSKVEVVQLITDYIGAYSSDLFYVMEDSRELSKHINDLLTGYLIELIGEDI